MLGAACVRVSVCVCVLADPHVMSAHLSVSVQHTFVLFMCITDF